MADSNINQSNVLTNSSVASLETAVRTSIFRDVSREHEFEAYLHHGIVLCDASRKKEFDRCLQEHPQDELNRWIGFFRFMPNDDGGIMSHINTLMEQAHGRLVHEWKHVDGHTHQLKQLIANVKQLRKLCKDFRIQDYEYECSTSNFLVEKPCGLMMNEHAFFMTSRMMDKLRIC
ncbi:unnamed protein product [Sphagnum troendelagicum]|uniref:Uncharacterized protein n=1 Tax=Sphagnum troendelagicum TaxID=128251 RepID=A0ABP0UI99_9BRYO